MPVSSCPEKYPFFPAQSHENRGPRMVYLLLSIQAPVSRARYVQLKRSYIPDVIRTSAVVEGIQAFSFFIAVLGKNALRPLYGLRTVKPFMRFKLGGFVYGKSHGEYQ